MTNLPNKGPGQMFEHELSAVFVRWWEESDLDETEMADVNGLDMTEKPKCNIMSVD